MVNPNAPTEAEIRALLLIYRGLVDNGRDHDSAARLVSQLDGIAFVKDDELDIERIASIIRAQSPDADIAAIGDPGRLVAMLLHETRDVLR